MSSYISKLEQDISSQDELDNISSYLMGSIKEEMYESLSHKVTSGSPNRKRKVKKPWWSNRLSELWNDQCDAAKSMSKGKSSSDSKCLRQLFIYKRKLFNREVQRSKRAYILQKQAEIDNLEARIQTCSGKKLAK